MLISYYYYGHHFNCRQQLKRNEKSLKENTLTEKRSIVNSHTEFISFELKGLPIYYKWITYTLKSVEYIFFYIYGCFVLK